MPKQNPSNAPRVVVVSVLNWNTSDMTIECVKALLELDLPFGTTMEIVVIDNGSQQEDFSHLVAGLPQQGVTLHRESRNLGFAGGTNVGIRVAVEKHAEFIWLVNSDAVVDQTSTLRQLLALMDSDSRCGAVSPKLNLPAPRDKTYFCGAYHDWSRRLSVRTDEAESKNNEMTKALDSWVPGTAMLLRMSAMEQVGMLDERFFAYYEDDEICARLSAAGWTSRVCFDVAIMHPMPKAETDRPPYYFYLMQRNHLTFWYENTPAAHRRLLWLRLMDQAFFDVNKLRRKGFDTHANASMLGILDFLAKRYGAPHLDRQLPFAMLVVRKISWVLQYRSLKALLPFAAASV